MMRKNVRRCDNYVGYNCKCNLGRDMLMCQIVKFVFVYLDVFVWLLRCECEIMPPWKEHPCGCVLVSV